MTLRLVVLLCLMLATPAVADEVERKLGTFRHRDGSVDFSIKTGSDHARLNGAWIACYDEHVIRSVHFAGLRKGELEALRGLIDKAIAALGK